MDCKSGRIRILNDYLRTTFTGGRVVVTASIAELEQQQKTRVLLAVRELTNSIRITIPITSTTWRSSTSMANATSSRSTTMT